MTAGVGILGPLIGPVGAGLPGIPAGVGAALAGAANALSAGVLLDLLLPAPLADGTLDGAPAVPDWGAVNYLPGVSTGGEWGFGNTETGQYNFGQVGTIQMRWRAEWDEPPTYCSNGAPNTTYTMPRHGNVTVSGSELELKASWRNTQAFTCQTLVQRIVPETMYRYKDSSGVWSSWKVGWAGATWYAYSNSYGPAQVGCFFQWVRFNGVDQPAPGQPGVVFDRAPADRSAPFVVPTPAPEGALIDTGDPSLADLVEDALAGALLPVAAPPSPQLPSGAGVPFWGGGLLPDQQGQQVAAEGIASGSVPLPAAPPAPALPPPSGTGSLPGSPLAPAPPGAVPITPTGPAPAVPSLPVPVTPPGTELTPIGPIGGGGTAPPATLEGIAAEVGRIEQKLLAMMRPQLPGVPEGFDWLDALAKIAEVLLALDTGTTYGLTAPCETVNEQGDPLIVEIPVEGSLSFDQACLKRLDAIAQLLQVHKDLKQPVCRPGRSTGQPVTVTFQEVT